MISKFPLVSIILVSWNSRAHLARCLPTLLAQAYPHYEVIVVDNASTDGTAAWLSSHYPAIQLLQNEQNIGFAAAANQGFAVAKGDVLVELNPDTTVEPDWLFPLVEALGGKGASQPPAQGWRNSGLRRGVGLATPRIMLMDEPHKINACGNEISLTGLTFCIGIGESADSFINPPIQPVPAISGAAFAMSRACYEAIGGFDDIYFTYFEDTDLSLRARLAGFEVVLAAESVVYHDYQFRFSPQKMYFIERNRQLTLLKLFHWTTLLRLLPPLLLGEAVAWGYALLRGRATITAKAQALGWFVCHWDKVRRRRATIRREIDDKELIALMTTNIRFSQTLPGALGHLLNRLVGYFLRLWKYWVSPMPTSKKI